MSCRLLNVVGLDHIASLFKSLLTFLKISFIVPPILGLWSAWDDCTETCGYGTKMRTRTCTPDSACPNCDGNGDCDCGAFLIETAGCFTPLGMYV